MVQSLGVGGTVHTRGAIDIGCNEYESEDKYSSHLLKGTEWVPCRDWSLTTVDRSCCAVRNLHRIYLVALVD